MKNKFRERVIREKKALEELRENDDFRYFSTVGNNGKTGWAFYYPMLSCAPWRTRECGQYCYLHSGHMTLDNFVRKTVRVYNFVENNPVDEVATKISYDIPYGITSFRWLGSGELTEKLLLVINRVVARRPDVKHYIYTKALDLAVELHPKITVNLSIDHSTKEPILRRLFTDPQCQRFQISYVQINANERIPKHIWDLIDVIHPLNKKRSIIESISPEQQQKICAFSINKRMTCLTCRRCIDSPTIPAFSV